MNRIKSHFVEALKVLSEFTDDEGSMARVAEAGDLMVASLQNGGKILSCGNGGSMSDAMHFAEELSGRFRDDRPAVAALSISDPSHITCVANDYGFDQVFSRFVEAVGKQDDVLLAISTSGNSPNVIKAAEAAKGKDMKVVALTGKDGGDLAAVADVEIRAPQSAYSDRAQEIHIKIIHALIDHIESALSN